MLARRFIGLAWVLAFSLVAAAQQGGTSALRPRNGPPSRAISIDVVVTPKSGPPVGGLQQKDFTILDNGKQPQPITSFQAFDGSNVPVILLIDSVNTDFNVVAQDRIEIDRFLHRNGGHLSHPTALGILTDDGVQLQGKYTQDGNAMAAAMDKLTIGLRYLTRATGTEGEGERLEISIKALRTFVAYEAGKPGRKVILWVSPGWHLLSGPEINLSGSQQKAIFDEITWLSTELRDAEMTIDAVNPLGVNEGLGRAFMYEDYLKGVKKPGDVNFANISLQVIANETGGLVVSSTDISGLLQQCMDDAGPYYRMSFEPPPAEHRDIYHSLTVKVDQPGVTAHTTTGYYDEP